MAKKNIIIKNNKISYILKERKKSGCKLSVVFLSGYRSDKKGKKAVFIEKIRKELGFEYLRFDYSGHGDSSGEINNLLLSNWVEESKILIKIKTKYPLILIGSSMGAWIALFLSFLIKRKIKGIIGIASAVDFTSIMLKKLNKSQYQKFLNLKKLKVESDYSKTPYFFSKKFIDDSKKFLLLKKNISIKPRTTLLYGMKDSSVDLMSQIKLLENLSNVRSTLLILKNSDHRMSSINDLKIIKKSLLEYVRNS